MRVKAIESGKPEKIVDKIVDGRVEKYYSEVALLEQPFVKDNGISVGDYVKNMIASLGENMHVQRFARFRLGE